MPGEYIWVRFPTDTPFNSHYFYEKREAIQVWRGHTGFERMYRLGEDVQAWRGCTGMERIRGEGCLLILSVSILLLLIQIILSIPICPLSPCIAMIASHL